MSTCTTNGPTIVLRSERLVLGPHQPENLDTVHAWENDDSLLAMSADSMAHTSIEEARKSLERWMRGSDDAIHLGIYLAGSGELIGFLQIACIDRENERCKIGIVVGDRSRWGAGYATEALRLAVRHVFTALDLNRIGAETYANNPRSIRLLQRVGFRREGVLRESVRRVDGFVDELLYGLLRREWQEGEE